MRRILLLETGNAAFSSLYSLTTQLVNPDHPILPLLKITSAAQYVRHDKGRYQVNSGNSISKRKKIKQEELDIKRKRISSFTIFICIFSIICSVNHASAIQINPFAEGFTNPTGLAINTKTRELYVNSGINGNLWSVPINDDGSAGGIKLVTSSFAPNYDIELDAEMNIYGLKHGAPYIYRLSDTGQVSKTWANSSWKYGTGKGVFPPHSPAICKSYISLFSNTTPHSVT